MGLNGDDVRKVAELARLDLAESEVEPLVGHLNSLLAQFEVLKQLDVTGVEPTSHTLPLVNVLRKDVARPSLARTQVLANAPEARDGCFAVPRILEEA